MKRKLLPILLIVTLGVLVFSCQRSTSDQSQEADLNAVRTEAVATYAFSMTGTLAPLTTATPTVTSLPSFTASPVTATVETTADSCLNLRWIEDVTIPDGTQMKANEAFTKTWLVQNTGSCAWPPGFAFMHVGGDMMLGT